MPFRRLLVVVAVLTFAISAAAQTPTLTTPSAIAAPGVALAVTITGIPGRFFALVGSTTGAGFTYAGVALKVGADVTILASGTLGVSGAVTLGVTPPFSGSVLDRYYLQAVTSALPSFVPLEPSAGLVLRNADLVGGITAVATTAAGAYDLSNVNGLVSTGTPGVGGVVPSGAGTRLVWNPRKSAFRVGTSLGDGWDDANVGQDSLALGYNTRAHGAGSAALGYSAQAFADGAIALGFQVAASGIGATALGYGPSASGVYAVAIGNQTVASGLASTALGDFTVASGPKSTALGSNATTAGFAGAFVYGDSSFAPGSPVSATAANQVTFRAAGGYRLFTNAGLTLGAELAPNATAWSTLSDANAKEGFRDLDGEEVLRKLAAMPIREWNYKAQGASIRHVGPTAQDFHLAFRLGEHPLRISTLDADGISLRAIQALEARTSAAADDREAMRAELERLRLEVAALREIVEQLRTAGPR